jgi:hypothetical protein
MHYHGYRDITTGVVVLHELPFSPEEERILPYAPGQEAIYARKFNEFVSNIQKTSPTTFRNE